MGFSGDVTVSGMRLLRMVRFGGIRFFIDFWGDFLWVDLSGDLDWTCNLPGDLEWRGDLDFGYMYFSDDLAFGSGDVRFSGDLDLCGDLDWTCNLSGDLEWWGDWDFRYFSDELVLCFGD